MVICAGATFWRDRFRAVVSPTCCSAHMSAGGHTNAVQIIAAAATGQPARVWGQVAADRSSLHGGGQISGAGADRLPQSRRAPDFWFATNFTCFQLPRCPRTRGHCFTDHPSCCRRRTSLDSGTSILQRFLQSLRSRLRSSTSSPSCQVRCQEIMCQCLVVCHGAAADAACDVCSLAGHVLVAPLREAPRFRELTPAEVTDIWWALFLSCM